MIPRRLLRATKQSLIETLDGAGQLQNALDARRRLRGAAETIAGSARVTRLSRRVDPRDRRPTKVIAWRGRAVVAVERPALAVHELMLANLDVVCAAFENTGVTHWLCPIDAAGFFRVGVREIDRAAAWDALLALADATLYVQAGDVSGQDVVPLSLANPSRRRRSAAGVSTWRVYRNYTDPHHRSLVGIEHSCQIEFWRPETTPPTADEPARLKGWRAPRSNLVSARLPADFSVNAERTINSRRYPTPAGFTLTGHPSRIDFPVDVVYTWVDGNELAWRERKEATKARLDGRAFNPSAMNASRYIDRDELRFSLRSLEAYADFVHHVWLVTDDQVPEWLDMTCGHLTVVDHRELFGDDGALPTFNSHAIEARLHHIDGLAEHYLYMNDDFFFGRRVTGELFFHRNGAWRFFPSHATIGLGEATVDDEPVDAAAKNGRSLLSKRFGIEVSQKLKHVPHPQRRSVAFALEKEFDETFRSVWKSQFRNTHDISTASSLIHHFGYVTGNAFPATIASSYVDVSGHNLEGQLDGLLRRRTVDAWCLNDQASQEDDVARQREIVHHFFERQLPLPSRYERTGGEHER